MILHEEQHMEQNQLSPWTHFLKKETPDDPYSGYKDYLLLRCEDLVGSITAEILKSQPQTSVQAAKEGAICLIMEQLLAVQYQHTPTHQAAMVASLFTELPQLAQFREEVITHAQAQKTFKNKLKSYAYRLNVYKKYLRYKYL